METRLFDNEYKDEFWETVQSERKPLGTGLDELDALMDGGFYPDLYVLAAPTGHGKTTLAIQIAAHIARLETPVLYVALEMSRKELQIKHISRLIFQLLGTGRYTDLGKLPTAPQLLYGAWKDEQIFRDASNEYFEHIAPNMAVLESVASMRIDDIQKTARLIQEKKGRAPLIIVDYLQVMPAEPYMSERQTADANILAFKRLSRSLECPVLVLSSMSRAEIKETRNSVSEKNKPIMGDSVCKESGTIEYTAGFLLGMYVQGATAYMAVLKNRYGKKTDPERPKEISFNGLAGKFGSL